MELWIVASTSVSHDSVVMIPNKFHPPESFLLPKCSFGSKNEKCLFRSEWCEKYSWLHYDVCTDAVFFCICMIPNGRGSTR